jgi:hypothetical protein
MWCCRAAAVTHQAHKIIRCQRGPFVWFVWFVFEKFFGRPRGLQRRMV